MLAAAILTWFLALLMFNVSSPTYTLLVLSGLALSLVHVLAAWAFIRNGTLRRRWWVLVPSVPLLPFFVDGIGRLLMSTGLGGFRILI